MTFFLIIQEDKTDVDLEIRGPFSSLSKAKQEAVKNWSPEPGWILTILSQDQKDNRFAQVAQAVVSPALVWL